MNRKGVTLVECLVVLAIIAAFAGLLATAAVGSREHKDPPQSWNLYTAQHDGHWFVKDTGGGVCHHPDCPCSGRKAEAEAGR